MGRPALEVADIFRAHGPAWREAQRGHLSLAQLKVMSAITQCRTAALGGHVLRCEGCGTDQIAYNSCRNRHCPKCQSTAAQRWLDARQADLLPVEYYHVVFTLPAPIADIAYQNKAVIYGLLFDVAAEVLQTIAADPKHLGARIGATLVLHTWGSALTHHPHVHGIVPGGGLVARRHALGGLPARVLPARARAVAGCSAGASSKNSSSCIEAGKLQFFGEHAALADAQAFKQWLAPMRQCEWVVYAKRPFAGPSAVLAYLSRYTHRVAISNSRLARPGRARRDLPLEGLPRQGQDALQGHDPQPRGVHAPLPAACAAQRLPSHPALRAAGQRQPQAQPRCGAAVARGARRCDGSHRGRSRSERRARVRSRPPSCAATAGDRW